MSFEGRTGCWGSPCHCPNPGQSHSPLTGPSFPLRPANFPLRPANFPLQPTLPLQPAFPRNDDLMIITHDTHRDTFKATELRDNAPRTIPAGPLIPSTAVLPSNGLAPFTFIIETPSRFESAPTCIPPLTIAPLLRWNEPAELLSDIPTIRSSANQRKRKASNASIGTAEAATKRTCQRSPSPSPTVDTILKQSRPHARSRSKSPAPPSFSAALSTHPSGLEDPDSDAVRKLHAPREPENPSAFPYPALSTLSLPNPIAESSFSLPSVRPTRSGITSSTATDLWWFVVGVTTNKKPLILPVIDIPGVKSSRPDPNHFPYLRCALCKTAWQVYPNASGVHSNLRRHLQNKHRKYYNSTVCDAKLKVMKPKNTTNSAEPRSPVTQESLLKHLVEWITATDQPLRATEHPSFRKLLLHLASDLADEDIPCRTKLTQAIGQAADQILNEHRKEMQLSEGKISLTNDVWTESNKMYSFIAITAHYIIKDENEIYRLRHRLIGFEYLPGSHSGERIAQSLFAVYISLGITHRLGAITMDNASSNSTAMAVFQGLLESDGAVFRKDVQRIRCFPHVINLAVQDAITALKRPSENPPPTLPDDGITWEEFRSILQKDVMAKCRRIVQFCRSSGNRREEFLQTIRQGNSVCSSLRPWWPEQLRVVELLREVVTRWSSTFWMIDRILELREAVRLFLSQNIEETQEFLPTQKEIIVLNSIVALLDIFNTVQTMLSASKQPTLPLAIPAYEYLVFLLKSFREGPGCRLSHSVDAALSKINKYLPGFKAHPLYNIATAIHPAFKLAWIEDADGRAAAKKAEEHLLQEMIDKIEEFGNVGSNGSSAHGTPFPSQLESAPFSFRSSMSFATFGSMRKSTLLSHSNHLSTPLTNPSADEPAISESVSYESIARNEMARYKDEEPLQWSNEMLSVEWLLQWWMLKRTKYPTIFKIVLDIIAIPASAVPSEEAFSSARRTTTWERNRLSTDLIRSLQLLKHNNRNLGRLEERSLWAYTEEDMNAISAGTGENGPDEYLEDA